ncbi:hypothetical protein EVAR_40533_1 [Eumeta japonica]|uniref:Uncharacterized protein n=1 Tax=Eumeta variegata TaxID=151549 RepID=A0A4C1XSS0_EUMVA|nr:hypothetical protein EVAR_40533_1 [Eumeta japonica]
MHAKRLQFYDSASTADGYVQRIHSGHVPPHARRVNAPRPARLTALRIANSYLNWMLSLKFHFVYTARDSGRAAPALKIFNHARGRARRRPRPRERRKAPERRETRRLTKQKISFIRNIKGKATERRLERKTARGTDPGAPAPGQRGRAASGSRG